MTSQSEVTAFLIVCIDYIGLGFHPDTDFCDYINIVTKERIFTDKVANHFNDKMSKAFEYCNANGLDIYEIALNQF